MFRRDPNVVNGLACHLECVDGAETGGHDFGALGFASVRREGAVSYVDLHADKFMCVVVLLLMKSPQPPLPLRDCLLH